MDSETDRNNIGNINKRTRLICAQLNLRNERLATYEVPIHVTNRKIDILCVTEPYTMKPFGKPHMIPGVPTSCKTIIKKSYDKIYSGILVFNADADLLNLEDLNDEYFVSVEYTDDNGSFVVISAYFPPSINIEIMLNRLDNILCKLTGKTIIICMDSNAHSELWGLYCNTDERGRKMEEFIYEKGFVLINNRTEPPTFSTANGESYIDLTLVNNGLYNYMDDWKVHTEDSVSDHRLITFKILLERNREKGSKTLGFNLNRANWDQYERKLEHLMEEYRGRVWEENPEEIEERIRIMTEIIIQAAEECIPRRIIPDGKTNWWNRELIYKRREVRRARKDYQRNRRRNDEALINTYKERHERRKEEYKKMVKESKRRCFENFIENELGKDPWGTIYKISREKLKIDSGLINVSIGEGNYTRGTEETLRAILNGLVEDDRTDNETEWHDRVRNEINLRRNQEEVEEFVLDDLLEAVLQIKNRKAPGWDGVNGELLKKAKGVMCNDWLNLMNSCLRTKYFPRSWKKGILKAILKANDKDPKDVKSRRPLTMLPELGKVFERMIKIKVENTCGEELISRNQYGFVKKRGTIDCIRRLVDEVDNTVEKYVGCIFLDIKGAFDGLWWPAVIRACNLKNIPKALIDLIGSYLNEREIVIKSKFVEVNKFLSKGCPQGSVIAPFMWNIVLDELLEKDLGCTVIAYADDICVIVRGETRSSLVERGRETMKMIEIWMSEQKLKLSVEKCSWVLMKGDLVNPPSIGKIYERNIKRKDVVKYLGIMIDKRRNYCEHVKYVSQKMRVLMMSLLRYVRLKFGKVRGSMKVIYERAVIPICTYACEVWGHSMKTKQRSKIMLSGQRLCAIAITGAYRSVSKDAALVLASCMPIDKLILIKRMKILAKRADENVNIDYESVIYDEDMSIEEYEERMYEHEMNRWQEEWNQSTKGRVTYAWIQNIKEWESSEQLHVKLTRGVIEILTGHGEYAYHLHKIGKRESPLCDCGEVDTPVHRIETCPLYLEERLNLFQERANHPQVGLDILNVLLNSPDVVDKINEWRSRIRGER